MSENIKVDFGDAFYPFGGLKRLKRAGTPDCFGNSRPFSLEGIGDASVSLIRLEGMVELDGRLIDPAVSPYVCSLRNTFGWLSVNFPELNPDLKKQPKMWCEVGFMDQLFVAPNDCYYDNPNDVSDGPIFYSFRPKTRGTRRDYLIIANDISRLQCLSVRFLQTLSS